MGETGETEEMEEMGEMGETGETEEMGEMEEMGEYLLFRPPLLSSTPPLPLSSCHLFPTLNKLENPVLICLHPSYDQ
jgi:hypothetical protein